MSIFENYNNEILSTNEVNLSDYITGINTRYNIMNIDAFNKVMELRPYIGLNECCIPHEYLYKFGVITSEEDSKNVKRLLTGLKIKYNESTDFRLGKFAESKSGGCTHKNIYLLHPNAFRKIIMRCQNTDVYADYFTFIDDCCKYYNAYQVLLKDKYIITLREKMQDKDTTIIQKDDKIDILSREIKLQHIESQKEINELKTFNKEQTRIMKLQHLESQRKIDELLNINQDIKEDTSAILGVYLEEAEKKEVAEIKLISSTDRSINVPIPSKQEYLIIFILKSGEFYYARGLFNYISAVCLKKCGTSLNRIIKDEEANAEAETKGITTIKKHYSKESEYLKYYKYIPNARHLIQVVIEQLDTDIIKTSANTIKFKTPVTNQYFINKIQEIYEQRLTIDISPDDTIIAKSKAKKTVRTYKPKSKITKNMIDTLR